ncbi:MAG TPA: universal stress protein [Candidatus Acidoferrales bacterium]|nr:universal stress protein [Candidatus Acidoferrales bacterium]
MAFPYKTILCPVDFDENSLAALDQAVAIARQLGASLILVHVLPMALALGEVPPPASLYEDQEKDAQAKLADIAKQKLGGLKHRELVYTGDVIGSLLLAQAKHQPDLVVIATHGRRGIARMFLGSVAEAVVRKATCPVLTVRNEIPEAQAAGRKESAAKGARSQRK